MRVLALLLGILTASTFVPGWPAAGEAPITPQRTPLSDALDRAALYVVRYEAECSAVVAEEHYTQDLKWGCRDAQGGGALGDARPGSEQRFWDPSRPTHREKGPTGPSHRELVSDVLMVVLPDQTWAGFRDVAIVDGHQVRDRAERLETLFLRSRATLRKIQEESARYNIGHIHPQFNLPTFALAYLHPGLRDRFAFANAGQEILDGTRTMVVTFTEEARPTVISDGKGHDVVSSGQFWIDPRNGEVLRSQVVAGDVKSAARVESLVSYTRHPEWRFLLPAHMSEIYDEPGRPDGPCVIGEAGYSNFRRFKVEVEEKVKRF